MGYNPEEKNRSYLWGVLLAIADTWGTKTGEINLKYEFRNFSFNPRRIWSKVEKTLSSSPNTEKILKEIQGIKERFFEGDFERKAPLEGLYLLGYHQYKAYKHWE